jgi:hypothetical protein
MRVDNGEPLGCPQHNTTLALALWLIGIDIDMIFNKPRCPQANAKVERMQDISARWVDLHKSKNIKQLQENLDREALVQRTLFPVSRLKNQTRITCFPELETSRRIFDENFFDEKRVYEYLSKKIYVRIVSTAGQITHFGQKVSIGLTYKHQAIEVKLDITKMLWAVYLRGELIKELKTGNLSKENLQNLTVYFKELKNVKT